MAREFLGMILAFLVPNTTSLSESGIMGLPGAVSSRMPFSGASNCTMIPFLFSATMTLRSHPLQICTRLT